MARRPSGDDDVIRRRWLRVVLVIGALLLVVAIAGGLWLRSQIDPSGPPGETISLVVPPGASTARIAAILDDKGVITRANLFRWYVRIRGGDPFEAGSYEFRVNSSFGTALDVLTDGPKVTFQRLTIPEGLTLAQVAERVGRLPGRSAEAFLAAAGSGTVRSNYQPAGSTNLEGLLFPDTYFVEADDDEATILQRMVGQFDTVAAELGLDQAAAAVGLNPYQAVTLASLVESEGKVAADRPKIARVIYNRLEKGMPLQIDATVIYARGGRRPGGRVLFRDLEIDSPYNTYRVKGLPPSPISVSGRSALEAALAPTPGPWLFYVKYESDGTHKFAVTLAEHNRNIADARRRGVNP